MIDVGVISTIMSYRLLSIVVVFGMFLILIGIIGSMCSPRRSQHYRKLLADMYVAGKIKILAKKENINLAEEEKNYNLWCKKKRLEYKDLDNAIEEDMKEKIVMKEKIAEDTEPKKD